MLKFLRNWLDDNSREIKRLQKTVQRINELEKETSALTDEQLQAKTPQFRARLEQGDSLDNLLPEAFAVVREASRRVLGMRHFDVQLLGGMVLHSGKIAEMRTGEGKTLVATLPVYLNALTGKGVHVVTVNDYLARRDSEWMGRVYKFLGLTVGLIVHGLSWDERKHSYNCDVVYGTNNEFGFDYLRDNMALRAEQLVQRQLYYAIVDEVDSILIDEARTPLIISGQADKATDHYYTFARLVPRLHRDTDYTVDEKAHTVVLTEEGVSRVEQMLGIENLYDDANMELNHHLNQALKAHALMKRDRDYVVKDGEVIIVDEFTGRMMFGRRYSDGLHQAIEAKEGVRIERESQTLATITFQNYFRMYEKLAGMTGTAETEQEEFRKIYNLDVVVIPTNKPMIRRDLPDVVYKTEQAKFKAVVEEIAQRHATGQPVLVGTISIEKSELLSSMLRKRGIPHQVLNAKYHDKEAEIVSQAGRYGAVTIATNMAGRGTDIVLGGNPEFLAQAELRSHKDYDPGDPVAAGKIYQQLLEKYKRQCDDERRRVVEAGGLHIIGTERHESRRIDNQLRGRSGRQGDPGSSQFFSSLEDDLMRLFGSDNIAGIMDKLGLEEDVPIEHGLVTRSIESAQKRVENRNFSIRKHVLEYDDVMNQQREVIYRQRMQVLLEESLKDAVIQMITESVGRSVDVYAPDGVIPEEWDLEGLLTHAEQLFLPGHQLQVDDLEDMGRDALKEILLEKSLAAYEAREAELGAEVMRELERMVMLRMVDEKWMDHLDAMDQLREGINLRAYGQKNPLVEYKFESYQMFQNMVESIQDDVVRYVFRVNVVQAPQQQRRTVENKYQNETTPQPVRREAKIGRNEPCPCGSGKKYKKCCGK
ncbi:preprotein translocase subunit SecA [Desulfallas thermosapovorans]|uniref:Protein translocase subunit SecA n=1 Tax=Desulfallas thermosapovorans DSM 6562 TaxID=1121431 RepID=A0A5S4ZS08_9FIRM|nr:preprotein translocase subunit SecA [Desulfallas thermosapovorans]TYO94813.1 preprotein translocase subunit SecA [Desulfallas thermosapovorans DSM 6562]